MRVAIIGAGICGSYLAWRLSEKGYRIFLFEKRAENIEKACSGLYSEEIFNFLPRDEILSFAKNKINSCIIYFPKRKIKLLFGKNFYVFERQKIEAYLTRKAIEGGTTLFRKEIEIKELKEIEKEFSFVIGCDGTLSIVRSFLGNNRQSTKMGVLGHYSEKNFSATAEVWPTKNGFFWKIPRGENIEYGILEDRRRAMEIFQHFLNKMRIKKLENIKSALLPDHLFIPKSRKFTLCGDSAGFVKPWSGGGVVWSLMGAEMLVKNFPNLLKYKREAELFFAPRIALFNLIRRMVYFLGFHFPFALKKEYKIENDFLFNLLRGGTF